MMRSEPAPKRHDLMYLLGDERGRAIRASVLVADQPALDGEVRAVFTDGVVVALSSTATLAIGEEVRLQLALDGAPGVVVVRALVRERRDQPDEREYRLRFRAQPGIDDQLPRELYAVFNRRRSERCRLTAPLRVQVSSTGGAITAVALLEGVSHGGCSLLIDTMTEQMLADCERVVLEIRRAQPHAIEHDSAEWTVEAIIRNRQMCDDGDVRYGCELAPHADDADSVARLTDYLLAYERDRRVTRAG